MSHWTKFGYISETERLLTLEWICALSINIFVINILLENKSIMKVLCPNSKEGWRVWKDATIFIIPKSNASWRKNQVERICRSENQVNDRLSRYYILHWLFRRSFGALFLVKKFNLFYTGWKYKYDLQTGNEKKLIMDWFN